MLHYGSCSFKFFISRFIVLFHEFSRISRTNIHPYRECKANLFKKDSSTLRDFEAQSCVKESSHILRKNLSSQESSQEEEKITSGENDSYILRVA